MTTWVNIRTGERVQAEAAPGPGWVTLAEAKVRYPEAFAAGEPEKGYKPTASDPYDPTYGSAQSRVALLGSSGFQWYSGEGPNALWLSPDGRLVPELTALKMASDPTPPRPSTALTFDEQMRLRQTPSVSYSYSPPDELDYAQEARARAASDAQIKRAAEESAREDVKLRVLIEKERVSAEAGRRAEAREIARDISDTQYRRDQAVERVKELNQAAINRAAEFNAREAADAADRTERARQANLADKRQNAVDITNFQQMPGDIAKLGAYLQARQGDGGSPISTAVGQGENFITDQSLAPLQDLLGVKAGLTNSPIFSGARMTPSLISAPAEVPQPIFAGVREAQAPASAPAPTEQPVFDPMANGGQGGWTQGGQAVSLFDAQGNLTLQGTPVGDAAPAPAPAAQPGILQTARMPMVQEGSYTPGGVDYGPKVEAEKATIFQRAAAQKSRERSGLRGDLTPIRYADPGTDPYLAELAAGVTAAERGVDTRLFERERQRITPRGYSTRLFGRTR